MNDDVNSFITTDYCCMLCNPILKASMMDTYETLIRYNLVDEVSKLVFNHAVKYNTKSSTQMIQNLHANWSHDIPISLLSNMSTKIKYYSELDDFNEISNFGNILNTYCNNILFKYHVSEFSKDKNIDKLLNKVKELKLHPLKRLPINNLSELDEEKLLELVGDNYLIPSCFDFINDTMVTGAYLKGTIVCVAAAPGKGKTNFLIQEIYHKVYELGKRVFWLAMGDMMEVDFIIRLGALFFNKSQKEIMNNIMEYYNNEEFKKFLSKIDIVILPSATLSSTEFIEAIDEQCKKMNEDSYDIIVVDYDANFSDTDEQGSMYGAHKFIYNNLVNLAKTSPRKLIFVASQIKNAFYETKVIPLDALAESSYKQNIIDVLVTISRFTKELYDSNTQTTRIVNYGFINLAKLRRGSSNFSGYISDDTGKLEVKTSAEINMLIGTE